MQFHPKVTAGVVAGAITSIVVAEFGRHGIQISGDEGSAITAILSFLAGFLMPSDDAGAQQGAQQP